MKTLTIKVEDVKAKLLTDQQSKVWESYKNENFQFVLKEGDYQELIKIKRAKNEKEKERSVMFFFIGMCMTFMSLIVVFNWNFQDKRGLMKLEGLEDDNFEEILEIPKTEQPPPPPPQVLRQPIVIEVPDEVILEEIEVDLDVEITEQTVIEEVEFAPIEEEVAEEIFEIVENAPVPVGGFKAFYGYVGENLKYPKEALRNEISGRVFVKFVVDKDGSLSDVVTIKGIGGGCDEEAVRVIENAPKWQPGKQRGRTVKV